MYVPLTLLKFVTLTCNYIVTLKIRTRSLKPSQGYIMPLPRCYIHANWVPICQLVYKISWKQKSVMPMPIGSAPKTICPLHLQLGKNKYPLASYLEVWFVNIDSILYPYNLDHVVIVQPFTHKCCCKLQSWKT